MDIKFMRQKSHWENKLKQIRNALKTFVVTRRKKRLKYFSTDFREMERYPHQIRNRGKSYLTQMSTDMTDDDEHIYIRPKVKFDQTETETEDQVLISTFFHWIVQKINHFTSKRKCSKKLDWVHNTYLQSVA
jgi:hypothetical protein